MTRTLVMAACVALVTAAPVLATDRGAPPTPKASTSPTKPPKVQLTQIAAGLSQPTDVQAVPGAPARLVVLQKGGSAQLLELGGTRDKPTVTARRELFRVAVKSISEMGLLGIAFHPRFADNGRFFVNYNPASKSETRIAEWRVDPKTMTNAREEKVLLRVAQPYPNHDGGQLRFGPDGMLYVGLGDGGSGGDPKENGQNGKTLLGAMLRLDVDNVPAGAAYGVPADNPKKAGWRPEVFAIGLRNPWRFAFDARGRLVVADVGQDTWEEVSIVAAGANLGWNVREGRHCFEPKTGCRTEGLKDPVFEYGHDVGQSITGGVVYEGKRIPALRGRYLVTDFMSGALFALRLPDDGKSPADAWSLGKTGRTVTAFGRAADGEVWAVDFGAGALLRLEPAGG